MSEYFQLICETCNEPYLPVLTTSPDELLYPDYEETAKTAGTHGSESLHQFHEVHGDHKLTTRAA